MPRKRKSPPVTWAKVAARAKRKAARQAAVKEQPKKVTWGEVARRVRAEKEWRGELLREIAEDSPSVADFDPDFGKLDQFGRVWDHYTIEYDMEIDPTDWRTLKKLLAPFQALLEKYPKGSRTRVKLGMLKQAEDNQGNPIEGWSELSATMDLKSAIQQWRNVLRFKNLPYIAWNKVQVSIERPKT